MKDKSNTKGTQRHKRKLSVTVGKYAYETFLASFAGNNLSSRIEDLILMGGMSELSGDIEKNAMLTDLKSQIKNLEDANKRLTAQLAKLRKPVNEEKEYKKKQERWLKDLEKEKKSFDAAFRKEDLL